MALLVLLSRAYAFRPVIWSGQFVNPFNLFPVSIQSTNPDLLKEVLIIYYNHLDGNSVIFIETRRHFGIFQKAFSSLLQTDNSIPSSSFRMLVCGFGIGKGQLFYTSAELDIYLTFSVEAFQLFQGLGYKFCITLNLIFQNYYFSEKTSRSIKLTQISIYLLHNHIRT